MRLLVGLGNPGATYANNRHNIGFMAVDAIARQHGFPSAKGRFSAALSEGRIGDERVAIVKPQTFMNLSGQAVGEAMRYYKLEPADVVVFHDDLDLMAGRVKVKHGGGHGGHNGLKDIDAHIGQDYLRVRLGIGHPGEKHRVTGHVLGDFTPDEIGWRDDLLDAIAVCAPHLLSGDGNGFTNALALRFRPPAMTQNNSEE